MSRSIDVKIAIELFNIDVQEDRITRGIFSAPKADDPFEYFIGDTNERIPHYSTDIKHAWEVMKKLHELGISWCIEQSCNEPIATVHFVTKNQAKVYDNAIKFIEEMERISESATCLAEAICKAALIAVEEHK